MPYTSASSSLISSFGRENVERPSEAVGLAAGAGVPDGACLLSPVAFIPRSLEPPFCGLDAGKGADFRFGSPSSKSSSSSTLKLFTMASSGCCCGGGDDCCCLTAVEAVSGAGALWVADRRLHRERRLSAAEEARDTLWFEGDVGAKAHDDV